MNTYWANIGVRLNMNEPEHGLFKKIEHERTRRCVLHEISDTQEHEHVFRWNYWTPRTRTNTRVFSSLTLTIRYQNLWILSGTWPKPFSFCNTTATVPLCNTRQWMNNVGRSRNWNIIGNWFLDWQFVLGLLWLSIIGINDSRIFGSMWHGDTCTSIDIWSLIFDFLKFLFEFFLNFLWIFFELDAIFIQDVAFSWSYSKTFSLLS